MRFECAHCQCRLSVEIDWNDRSEIPVQCGKCEGISIVRHRARAAHVETPTPPKMILSPSATTQAKPTPPPFRATEVKVPNFLKEKAEESIRAFDSETEVEAMTVTPTIEAGFDSKKKWLAIAGAVAILSGSYMIWNSAKIIKKTYRFSQTANSTSNESPPTTANIAN